MMTASQETICLKNIPPLTGFEKSPMNLPYQVSHTVTLLPISD